MLTITQVADAQFTFGNLAGTIVTATPAAGDYVTGGYPLGPAEVGLRTLACVVPMPSTKGAAATTMPVPAWDQVNQKLQAFESAAVAATPAVAALLAECAANTDLSAYQFQLLCLGTP